VAMFYIRVSKLFMVVFLHDVSVSGHDFANLENRIDADVYKSCWLKLISAIGLQVIRNMQPASNKKQLTLFGAPPPPPTPPPPPPPPRGGVRNSAPRNFIFL